MPKKKKQELEEDIFEPEQEEPIIEPVEKPQPIQIKEIDNDDIPDELQSIIDECGSDCSYTVGVFRYNDKTQQKEKVGTYQVQEFNPDMLAKTYGGGKYEYMIRVGNKLHRRLTTTYATAIVPEKPQVPTLQEIQNMLSSRQDKDDNTKSDMLKFMELQQQQNTAIITALLTAQQNQKQQSADDSFDKVIKLMTILGVKNANADTERFISIFQKGLNLSKDINSLREDENDEDEDSGLISKLVKKLVNSDMGADLIQKLLSKGQQLEQPTIQEPLIQTPQVPLQTSSIDIVKAFLNKYKKKILIEYNSKTTAKDLADFYYNGIIIDDELVSAFTEIFLGDVQPIINDIAEFNETNISQYVKSFLDNLKDMLYNNDTENKEEVEDNAVSTESNTDKR